MNAALGIALVSAGLIATPAAAQEGPLSDWTQVFAADPVASASGRRAARRLPATSTIDLHGDPTLFKMNRTYQYDFGHLILGGEIDRNRNRTAIPGTGASTEDTRHLRARIGFDAGAFLPYAVLGYSWQDTSGTGHSFRDEGAAFGVGMAYQLNDWVVVGTELVDSDLSKHSGLGLRDQLKTTLRFSFEF